MLLRNDKRGGNRMTTDADKHVQISLFVGDAMWGQRWSYGSPRCAEVESRAGRDGSNSVRTWGPIPMWAPCSRRRWGQALPKGGSQSATEADAVMPHNRLTARTSVISGLADIERMKACTVAKDGQPFNYGAKAHNCAKGVNKRGIRGIARS